MKHLVLLFSPLLLCATAFAEMVVVPESAMPVKGVVASPLVTSKTQAVHPLMDDQSQKQLLNVFNTPVMRAQVEQIAQHQITALANAGIKDPKEQERWMEKHSAKMVEVVNKLAGIMGREFNVMFDRVWGLAIKVGDTAMSYICQAILYGMLFYALVGCIPGVGPSVQRMMFGDGILVNLLPLRWFYREQTFFQRLMFGFFV